jgi:hypothetical protein
MWVGNSIGHANRSLLKEKEKWSIPEGSAQAKLIIVTLQQNLSFCFRQSVTKSVGFEEMQKGAAKSCPYR